MFRFLSRLTFLALVLAFGVAAWAQGAGSLTGEVRDPSGAVVPSAKLTLTNTATGVTQKTEPTTAGIYRFPSLPITGTYTLVVEAKGFRTFTVKDIVVSVGTTVTRDVTLQIGASTEVVEVNAGAETVKLADSSVSQLVDQRIWQEMPLSVRNQNDFVTLVAGSVPDYSSGRGASVNGTRTGTGNYLVDGMDNNEQGQGGRGQIGGGSGGAATSISPEAIQEYRVVTNSFAAEYGKAGGFTTDTVLKGGTNSYHGSLFEYNRVQALAANDYYSNKAGLKDSLVRNQFGGSFGGPIIKDKLFFNYSSEYQRMRTGSPVNGMTTTQDFLDFVKSGKFESWMETGAGDTTGKGGGCMQMFGANCPVGSLSHAATLGPIFQQLEQHGPFPVANADFTNKGNGYYTAGITYPVNVYGQAYVTNPSQLNEERYSGKLDWVPSTKDTVSYIMLFQHGASGDKYGGGYGWGPAYLQDGVGVNTGVTWNHTIKSNLLNSAKVSYLRHRSDYPAPQGTLGIPQIYTALDMDWGFGLYSGSPQYFTDNQFQVQDSLTLVSGKHSWKVGGEYRRIRNGSTFYNDAFGTFYPWGVEDLVTDLYFTQELEQSMPTFATDQAGSVYTASAAVNPATGEKPEFYRGFRGNEYAWYVQDDWRVSSRFTVNLGLRYEYFGPPHNFQPNIDSNYYFGSPITPIVTASTNPYYPTNSPYYAQVANGGFQVRNNEIWNKDTNNFGPRIGFSWDMMGNQKLVMRAGFGIMYDRIYNNLFENIRFNPPYFSDNQTGAGANGIPFGAITDPGIYAMQFNSNAYFANGVSAVPNPRHMDQNMLSPYYEQFHYGFQYEFAKGWVVEPEYVGTLGHKLTGIRDINTFNGRTVAGLGNKRINTKIGADNYRSNDYSSNYHGLQLSLRKSFGHGLTFNSAYTYSKEMDTISDAFNGRGSTAVTDPMNIRADYGPGDIDLKHRWITTVSYDLPFFKSNRWIGGWSTNAIIDLRSGLAFSPYSNAASYDLNKNGLLTDRVVPTGPVHIGDNPDTGYLAKSGWAPYVCPASVNGGQWCDAPIGRGSVYGPGFKNVDFNVLKKFKVAEGKSFTFQASFFNLFNHTNFALPVANFNSGSFGKSTTTYGDPRETQLALRFDF